MRFLTIKNRFGKQRKHLKTANNQYYNGEINYLEWTLLVNQAFEIENKYTDRLKRTQ